MPGEKQYNSEFLNYIKEHNIDETLFNVMEEDSSEQLKNKLNALMEEKKNIFEPAYDNNSPIPGEEINIHTVDTGKTLKEEAEGELIKGVALRKAKAEKAAYNALPIEQRVKDFWIKTSIKNWVNDCFDKHGFEPSGRQKRDMKRKLERNYGKKPGYSPNPKQYEEIVDYLNMPSSTEDMNKNNPMKNQRSTGQNISSLLSSI